MSSAQLGTNAGLLEDPRLKEAVKVRPKSISNLSHFISFRSLPFAAPALHVSACTTAPSLNLVPVAKQAFMA